MARNPGMARRVAALAALVIALAAPVLAHHSRSMFADDKTISLEGTMTEVAWANPHSLFFVEARPTDQPDAPMMNWSVEGPRPRELNAMGWERDDIKAGAKVRITGHPRRDGKRQILLIEISDDQGHHFAEKPEAEQ